MSLGILKVDKRLFFEHKIKFCLLFCWLVIVLSQNDAFEIISQYAGFIFLGVMGAIFANSTGAGGGVVFVPFFNQLSMSNDAIVATSFAIQCCGMTAGAFTWYSHYKKAEYHNTDWQCLPMAVSLTAIFSVVGIVFAQYVLFGYTNALTDSLHLGFGVFSVLLSIAIFASIPLMKKTVFANQLSYFDYCLLGLVSFLGGIVTAWLSVGVGELVAVYLILRGFSITFSIAVAVIISAITVWSAISYHLFVSLAIYWEVLMFAGAGAIVGGLIAKSIVMRFSVVKLKVFFASWVMVMGIAGLPVFN